MSLETIKEIMENMGNISVLVLTIKDLELIKKKIEIIKNYQQLNIYIVL